MAFVDIIKPKSPMGVENRLRPYKRGEAEITSDVCYEVLQATNFGRSLRDMLDCMAKLPDEVLSGEKFKEILIAVMAGREQPDNVVERVRKLVERGGYADAVPSEPVLIPTGYGEEALQSHFERRMVLHLDDAAVNAADFPAMPSWYCRRRPTGLLLLCPAGIFLKILMQRPFPKS